MAHGPGGNIGFRRPTILPRTHRRLLGRLHLGHRRLDRAEAAVALPAGHDRIDRRLGFLRRAAIGHKLITDLPGRFLHVAVHIGLGLVLLVVLEDIEHPPIEPLEERQVRDRRDAALHATGDLLDDRSIRLIRRHLLGLIVEVRAAIDELRCPCPRITDKKLIGLIQRIEIRLHRTARLTRFGLARLLAAPCPLAASQTLRGVQINLAEPARSRCPSIHRKVIRRITAAIHIALILDLRDDISRLAILHHPRLHLDTLRKILQIGIRHRHIEPLAHLPHRDERRAPLVAIPLAEGRDLLHPRLTRLVEVTHHRRHLVRLAGVLIQPVIEEHRLGFALRVRRAEHPLRFGLGRLRTEHRLHRALDRRLLRRGRTQHPDPIVFIRRESELLRLTLGIRLARHDYRAVIALTIEATIERQCIRRTVTREVDRHPVALFQAIDELRRLGRRTIDRLRGHLRTLHLGLLRFLTLALDLPIKLRRRISRHLAECIVGFDKFFVERSRQLRLRLRIEIPALDLVD